MKTGVFIERDGILNATRVQGGYPISPRLVCELRINKAAIQPLQSLKNRGLLLIATTNQPGLSQGCLCRRELDLMHTIIAKQFELDDIMVCPHDHADDCPCRKPQAGLLQEAAFKWHLDLDHSYVISDKWMDARAAHLAGCTSVLLESPWIGNGHHDFVVPSLASIAERILNLDAAASRFTRPNADFASMRASWA